MLGLRGLLLLGGETRCSAAVFSPLVPGTFLPPLRVLWLCFVPFPGYKVVLRGEMQGKTILHHLVQIRSLLLDFLVCIDIYHTSEKPSCEKLVE